MLVITESVAQWEADEEHKYDMEISRTPHFIHCLILFSKEVILLALNGCFGEVEALIMFPD